MDEQRRLDAKAGSSGYALGVIRATDLGRHFSEEDRDHVQRDGSVPYPGLGYANVLVSDTDTAYAFAQRATPEITEDDVRSEVGSTRWDGLTSERRAQVLAAFRVGHDLGFISTLLKWAVDVREASKL